MFKSKVMKYKVYVDGVPVAAGSTELIAYQIAVCIYEGDLIIELADPGCQITFDTTDQGVIDVCSLEARRFD